MKRLQVIRQVVQVGAIVAVAVLGIGLSTLLAGGSKLLSVQSGSMYPAIKKGDLVSVVRTPARELRVGDVITYTSRENNNQTITHRIESITGDMQGRITTKGDANQVADKAVVPSQIIGRVEHKLPYVGYAVDFIKQPLGLILIIYLPALFLVGSEIRRLTAYYRSIRPYSIRVRRSGGSLPEIHIPAGVLAILIATTAVLGVAVPASAALKGRSQLTDNTIQFALPAGSKPEAPKPATPKPTTETRETRQKRPRSQEQSRHREDDRRR